MDSQRPAERASSYDISHAQPLLGHSHSTSTAPVDGRLSHRRVESHPGPRKTHRSQRSQSLERPVQARNRGLAQPKHGRLTNKTVPLPLEAPTELGEPGSGDAWRSIRTFCVADGFILNNLSACLREMYSHSTIDILAECLHCCLPPGDDEVYPREIFFLEYGVIIFWGLAELEISKVLTKVHSVKYMVDPLTDDEMEQDTFSVVIGAGNGSIANDTITLPQVYYSEWRIKMAISHALAQSSKLCLYEERMSELVTSTKDMPTHLAKTGKVNRTRKEIAQLIGTVFIHKSNVNLLSSVLDTPEYFWAAPDSHQALYKRVTEYLELEQRITVLNNRFEVLTELLNIVREHENNLHIARLEWIVIWLIVIEVIVGLLECASILGFVKEKNGGFISMSYM